MGCCGKKPVDIAGAYGDEKSHGVTPANSRKCRDVLCILLFVVFWVGMLAIAAIGFMHGEPKRLLYGADYNGTTCGTGKHEDKPLAFYPRISQDLLEQATNPALSPTDFSFYGVCVASCPNAGTYICNYEAEEEISSDSSLTTDESREKERKWRATNPFILASNRECWLVAISSETVFYRCLQLTESNSTSVEKCVVPGDEPEYYDEINGVKVPNGKCEIKRVITTSETMGPAQDNPLYSTLQTTGATIGRIVGDLQETWPVILLCGGVLALVLGFIFVILLRFCAGCIVWIMLWSFVALLLLFALMLSAKGGIIGTSELNSLTAEITAAAATAGVNATETIKASVIELPETLKASEGKQKAYAVAAYITFALAGMAFLLVCFFQKKIRIAVGIVKEASRALQRLPLLVFFPVWPFLMLLVLFAYAVIVGAYVYSSGKVQLASLAGEFAQEAGQNVTAEATTTLSKVNPDQTMKLLVAYHFFGLLWTAQLINAISMCTIAGAVCRYYWSRNKTSDEMGRFPVITSFKNCFRYHFGSLAFGAFIIAVVQFVRAALLYLDHQTQDLQKNNLVLKVVMKVVQCCLWCLEKCLRFLSKNAYILIAMKGHSFCASARDAFKIILSNITQVGTVSTVTFLLLGAGKVAIALGCAITAFAYLEKNDEYNVGGSHELSSPMAPILLALLLGWFVGSTLIGVYEMAIDTILLCVCEDKELNKVSGQYFMSDSLKNLVNNAPHTGKTAKTNAQYGQHESP